MENMPPEENLGGGVGEGWGGFDVVVVVGMYVLWRGGVVVY